METKPRAGGVIASRLSEDGQVIEFDVREAGSLRLNLTSVNPAIMRAAAIHGFIQRVSDAAALSRNTDTGKPATPEEKMAAMKVLVDHYNSGADAWRIARPAGEGSGTVAGITLRAVSAVQGVEIAVMRERLDKLAEKRGVKPAALLRELAKAPDVIRKTAEIRAATSKVDVAGLLDELGDGED